MLRGRSKVKEQTVSDYRLSDVFNNNNSNIDYNINKQAAVTGSRSDYVVTNAYSRSGSQEPLIEQSRTMSEGSFTFDNPAYINSYDELTTRVSLGAATSTILHSYRPGSTYGQLSRSLDSIQDVVHDGSTCTGQAATLPGAVLSHSDETVNEACTVRNIVLDDSSQAWEGNSIEDVSETAEESTSHRLQVNIRYKWP